MSIVPLPLPAQAEARALLHHLLEHGDIVDEDATGRTIVQLALDHWVLERLMAFDAEVAELENQGDDERDVDDEVEGAPVVRELVRPRVIRRRRAMTPSFGQVG
jgi:hypothetical protein